MAIIHGVDTDLIKQYGDISEKNEVFGSHREYKLVRGYDMPEVLASLTFLDACDVLSARF